MIYKFFERDMNGMSREVARATVNNGAVSWSGAGKKSMRRFLTTQKFAMLNGKGFDESDKRHWKILPKILSGSRLWVVKVSSAKKGTLRLST